ncbi:MAG TPA: SpoIIE family protein phosphatase [Bdellovibrionota bacterium]|nr:SpoIIE family protein phosphatase [Bdellovibrionota bacterium]
MNRFGELSLKTRLVAAFGGVVLVSALLSSIVYSVALVTTMKKSAKDKIEETTKVALTQIDQRGRGLEIYADLISSDQTFGQVLSFDSSLGISQKIEEFRQLSQADVVAFVPKPERYVEIKEKVFLSSGSEALAPFLKTSAPVLKLMSSDSAIIRRGWLPLDGEIYLLAMKPVLHFGANMGIIILALRTHDSFAKDIASATGTDIILFDEKKIFGSSIQPAGAPVRELPNQTEYAGGGSSHKLVENFEIGGMSYLAFFVPLLDLNEKRAATLAIEVSNKAIRETRSKTLRQVLLVAALAASLSGVIGYFLAKAISTPLHRITQGILSIIDRGDLGIRISGTFGAEMGILTRSFNRLLTQLQDAHEKLAASERRMKQELTMASTVQEMLFPERVKSFSKLELASFIESSTETGGDWYGYTEDRAGQNVSVMIGDVTGHGMSAALITAIANGFFKGVQESEGAIRKMLREMEDGTGHSVNGDVFLSRVQHLRDQGTLSMADLLALLNQMILDSTKGSILMTFFASVFDSTKSELRYANAGHNRPFLCRPQTDGEMRVTVLPSPPSSRLGEILDVKFLENSVPIQRGDVLIWYTDGLLECENQAGEMYGKRRVLNILRKAGSFSAEDIRNALVTDAYQFFGDQPRKDDITLVAGRVS